MKNLFSYLPKKLIASLVVIAAIAGVTSVAIAGFGPDRPTMAWSPASNGADHVTFNSFTGVGNGIGDERDFFRGVQSGVDANWTDPVNNVQQDAEVVGKIYIHNNADPTLNDAAGNPGVAKNVTVRVALPTGASQTQEATAYIAADNASPKQIFDTLDMTGANAGFFELAYEPGSAQLHEGAVVTPLSDSLVTSGVNIGDQKGCFEFVREITFKLKVKMPQYQVSKLVRLEGQTKADWKESITAQPGQMLEWSIEFRNIGRTVLNNVILVDDMPKNMVIESGSVKFYDGNFPNGTPLNNDVIQKNGSQLNVNIGNSNFNTNAIVTFKGRVPASDSLDCGLNHLVNAAYATPETYHTIKDEATVDVTKQCENPGTPVYECAGLDVTKMTGRKISIRVNANASPASRVQIKNYEYNFGDGSTVLVTDKNPVEYTFAKDGTYKVSAKINFTVDGQMKTSTQVCQAVVTFTVPPTTIPDTGFGSMIGALSAVTIVGAILHRVWTIRRAA